MRMRNPKVAVVRLETHILPNQKLLFYLVRSTIGCDETSRLSEARFRHIQQPHARMVLTDNLKKTYTDFESHVLNSTCW